MGMSKATNAFFYTAAAARDFQLTEGSRDSDEISLTDFGREYVFAPNPNVEGEVKKKAFFNIDVFKRVVEFYRGAALPEMKYLSNTLENEFGLAPETHEEFSRLFRENCEFAGIGGDNAASQQSKGASGIREAGSDSSSSKDTITLAEPEQDTGLKCFVIMPFRERDSGRAPGFFDEILTSLFVPAGRAAGFRVTTANRQGTEVIHSTIINDLLNADLVLADLTDHNPNVLFELGMRMADDKPIALVRAKGTGPIFDVDNMLRVYDYDPNLWTSTIKRDLPKLTDHIKATWSNRDDENSYMRILRKVKAEAVTSNASESH